MGRNKSAKKTAGTKDLPSKTIAPKKADEVRGGRRVDFVEAYINEIKLPSSDQGTKS